MNQPDPRPVVVALGDQPADAALAFAVDEARRHGCGVHVLHVVHALPQGPEMVLVQAVDVEAVLSGIAAKKGSDLNWRTSIVDLMKLLDLDSSLDNRKELATELGYPGAKDGSAEMNIWLIKAVMRELEKNGGTVPANLKD